jgi:hypothetical protein
MYRVKWAVTVEECGNVTNEEIAIEASGVHDAIRPGARTRKPDLKK